MKELDAALKTVANGLKTIAQGIEKMAARLEKATPIEHPKQEDEPKATAKTEQKVKKAKKVKKAPAQKAATKKPEKGETAPDVVLAIIAGSAEGIDAAAISEKTGFNNRKVANAVYRLKKTGKIKAINRGVYTVV